MQSTIQFVRFVSQIASLYSRCKDDEILVFRGHSRRDYFCVPGIFRESEKNASKIGHSECSSAHEIMVECPEEFDKRDHLSCLVKMQHYGLKTRLLDFSRNPLVALYFACGFNPESAGSVVICKLKKDEIKHHSSDTVLCLASLPFLSEEDKASIKNYCSSNLGGILDEESCKNNKSIRHLYHEIKSQYPAFDFEIKAEDLMTSCFVAANKDNERMRRQNGLFAVYGLDERMSRKNVEKHIIATIEIPKDQKGETLRMLEHFGIDDSVIYAGLDRAAAQLYGKQLILETSLDK